MTWGFVAGAAITVVGGAIAGSAAKSAANTQAGAANTATQAQLQMYNQTRDDQAPWRAAGSTAIGQMSAGTQPGGQFDQTFDASKFQTDPGYQFRLDQGTRGVEASASARGGVLSGAALKGIDQYNQGFASNEYQNAYNRYNNDQSTRYNRLASIAGQGQTSVTQTGAQGTTVGGQIGSNTIGAGNAQAAGTVAQGNIINSGAQTLGNYYMQQQYQPNNLSSYYASNSTGQGGYAGGQTTQGGYTLTGVGGV